MKKLAGFAFGIIAVLLLMFYILEVQGVMPMENIGEVLPRYGKWAAAVSGFLLAADLVLPVPSSVLMTLKGVLIGPIWGSLVSFAGSMAGAALGFGLGRRFGRPFVLRISSEEEISNMDGFIEKYGPYGILLSRPVPMMTETVSCLAGLSDMSFRTFLFASALGTLPICVLYAWAGAASKSLQSMVPAFIAVMAIPVAAWFIVALKKRLRSKTHHTEHDVTGDEFIENSSHENSPHGTMAL